MKIVLLTSTEMRHDYFCLEIIKEFENVLIIQEPKGSRNKNKSRFALFAKSKHKLIEIKRLILKRIFQTWLLKYEEEVKTIESQYFSEASSEFRTHFFHLIKAIVEPGKSINNKKYVKILRELKPDIICVMGTCLIRKKIMSIPEYILNIHLGLSPYYRGGRTNFWPIVNKEPQYCGVTVHKISLGIDSGDIIYNGLPKIEMGDTATSINSKLIIIGTELMKRAIRNIENDSLTTKKQWLKGKLYNSRDFNGYYAFKYHCLCKKKYIDNFVNRQNRGEEEPPKGLKLYTDDKLPE